MAHATLDFLRDVLITATEGGIGYWARVTRRNIRTIEAVIIGDFTGEELRLQDDDLQAAIRKVCRGEVEIRRDLWRDIVCAVGDDDASEIDAEAADAIVQIALFGEIVYG